MISLGLPRRPETRPTAPAPAVEVKAAPTAVELRAYYAGARYSRLETDWWTQTCSSDQEVKSDALKLRERARQLSRDWPYAKRYRSLLAQNVIGPEGICLEPRVRDRAGEFDAAVNAELKRMWTTWCEAEHCTVDGRLSFLEVQHLWAKTEPTDGEFIVRMVSGFDNPFGFALELIDVDQLDLNYNDGPNAGGNQVVMGVEMDRWQRPVAFHFRTSHPSDPSARRPGTPDRTRVPAADIIHLFLSERINQKRGITWFYTVMLTSRMLEGYLESELVAARVGASNCGFIVTKGEEGAAGYVPPVAGVEESMEAAPGVFRRLGPGEEIQSFASEHPNGAFGDFHKAVMRQVGSGLDLSMATLASDLSDANYSSMREGKLSERDVWKCLQVRLAEKMHRRVYRRLLESASLTGAVRLPSDDYTAYLEHMWRPRTWPLIEPEKDLATMHSSVQLGIDSRTRIAASLGRNLEEVFADLDRENQLAKEYGIVLGADTQVESFGDVNDGNKPPPPVAGEKTPRHQPRLIRSAP